MNVLNNGLHLIKKTQDISRKYIGRATDSPRTPCYLMCQHELDNVNAFDYIGNLKIIKETSVRMFAIFNILQIMINQSNAHC